MQFSFLFDFLRQCSDFILFREQQTEIYSMLSCYSFRRTSSCSEFFFFFLFSAFLLFSRQQITRTRYLCFASFQPFGCYFLFYVHITLLFFLFFICVYVLLFWERKMQREKNSKFKTLCKMKLHNIVQYVKVFTVHVFFFTFFFMLRKKKTRTQIFCSFFFLYFWLTWEPLNVSLDIEIPFFFLLFSCVSIYILNFSSSEVTEQKKNEENTYSSYTEWTKRIMFIYILLSLPKSRRSWKKKRQVVNECRSQHYKMSSLKRTIQILWGFCHGDKQKKTKKEQVHDLASLKTLT